MEKKSGAASGLSAFSLRLSHTVLVSCDEQLKGDM
jgi:hypothetical protein